MPRHLSTLDFTPAQIASLKAGVTGGAIMSFTTISTNSTLTDSYETVEVTATVTITLPTAVGRSGQSYDIINTSAGSVTVNTTSSQTIGNIIPTTSATITTGNSLTVVSNGANWRIR